jgi:PAS domain-containing protein
VEILSVEFVVGVAVGLLAAAAGGIRTWLFGRAEAARRAAEGVAHARQIRKLEESHARELDRIASQDGARFNLRLLEMPFNVVREVAADSSMGLVVTDDSDVLPRIIWANEAAAVATGVSVDLMMATPLADLIHPDDLPSVVEVVDGMVHDGHGISRFENRWRHPETGESVRLRWTSTPYVNGRSFSSVTRCG